MKSASLRLRSVETLLKSHRRKKVITTRRKACYVLQSRPNSTFVRRAEIARSHAVERVTQAHDTLGSGRTTLNVQKHTG